MEIELLKSVVTQGPWAALFVALLWWVLRDSARREDRLTAIVDEYLPQLTASITALAERVESLCRMHAQGVGDE